MQPRNTGKEEIQNKPKTSDKLPFDTEAFSGDSQYGKHRKYRLSYT